MRTCLLEPMTPNWVGQWGAWFCLCLASQDKDEMGATAVGGITPGWLPNVTTWILTPQTIAGLDRPGRFQRAQGSCTGLGALLDHLWAMYRLDSQTWACQGPRPQQPQKPHLTFQTQESKNHFAGDSLNGSLPGNAGCWWLLSPWHQTRVTLCLYLFFLINFYWSVVDLQCTVSFFSTAKWISYIYMHLHSFQTLFPYRPL